MTDEEMKKYVDDHWKCVVYCRECKYDGVSGCQMEWNGKDMQTCFLSTYAIALKYLSHRISGVQRDKRNDDH